MLLVPGKLNPADVLVATDGPVACPQVLLVFKPHLISVTAVLDVVLNRTFGFRTNLSVVCCWPNSPAVLELLPNKLPVVVEVGSDVVVRVAPNVNPEAAGKENPGTTDAPVEPRARPVDAVLSVVVAAVVVANPDNDPVIGVVELDTTTGTPGVVNPVLAGVAVVPPNLKLPPRDNLLVLVVTGVAPRVSTELVLLPTLSLVSVNPDEAEEALVGASPGVYAGIGLTIAGAVCLPATVKPCNGAELKLNPPLVR